MPNNLTDEEENRLLDLSLLDTDEMALTSVLGTDSSAGTEVAGGSYARQVLTWDAAADGSKAISAALGFTVMPATDVQGWAIYDTTGSSRKWYGLFNPTTATAQTVDNTITAIEHGFVDGDKVVFLDGYSPAGLTGGTTYYVRDSTTDAFSVSYEEGGGSDVIITADTALVVVGRVLTVEAGAAVNIASGDVICSLS